MPHLQIKILGPMAVININPLRTAEDLQLLWRNEQYRPKNNIELLWLKASLL